MRFVTVSSLAALIAAIAVSPVIAQADNDQPSPPTYRSLMPIRVDIERFELVGSAEFGIGTEESKTVEGWSNHNFDTVVAMPLDNLASCSNVTVSYASGEEEEFPLLRPGLLSQSQLYQLSLRGEPNDVDVVEATCRALGGDAVTIGFYGATGDLF